MTEQELADWVPIWQMPQQTQLVLLYVFGSAALLCLGVGIWLAVRQKSWMPLAYFAASLVTVNLEPMIARMSSASHAQIGQISAFISEGRSIPWHVVLVYTAYFGFGYYFLIPAFQARKMTSRLLWSVYLGLTVVALLFELPFIKMGMWGYFGPQAWQPWGGMPVYFAFANVSASFIGCALLAAVLPLLPGLSRLWVVLLGPAFTIGAHFAVCWPVDNLRTSAVSHGADIGAAITIVLCLLTTYLIAQAFTPSLQQTAPTAT